MDQGISRRAMVGTVLAAGGAAAAGWMGGVAPVAAAGAAPPTAADEVGAVIADEVNESVREMVRRPGPGARRFGGSLRMYAAHGRSKGLDQRVAKYFRDRIRTEGRDAVLLGEPDWAYLQAEARRLGVDQLTPSPVDMAARKRALDAMLAGKYTAFLDAAAKEITRRSHDFDARNIQGLRPVLFADGPCIATMEMEGWAQMLTRVACTTSLVIWGDVPVCAVAIGAWVGIWIVNQESGCHS